MRTLEEIFKGNTGRRIHRHMHVLNIYAEFFEIFRNKEVRILEIGITGGGSLLMWKEFFGPKAKLFGLDISSSADDLKSDPQIEIYTGDQGVSDFMEDVVVGVDSLDIVIDDGSHISRDQIVSFENLFPCLRENGIYAIEDLHCSYRAPYGGGYKGSGTIIEYMKDFIDWLHVAELDDMDKEWYPSIAREVYGLHFFSNVLLMEKNSSQYNVSSPLLTGEGTVKDANHEIMGPRYV